MTEVLEETGADPLALVKELKDAVESMKQGQMAEADVERIALAAVAASKRKNPGGFEPDDVEIEAGLGKFQRATGLERWGLMVRTPAVEVAKAMRKPVEAIREFQAANDTLLLLSAITKQAPEELAYFHDFFVPARQQAMDTKTVGEGLEMLKPVEMSAQIIEKLEGELQVLNLFPVVPMPTNPFRFPTKGARKNIALLAEALEPDVPKAKKLIPSAPSWIELAAAKFAGEIVTSKELEEDAAIAILPFLQEELIEWLTYDLEDASINGDAVGAHMDADVVAADDYRKGWNGLRASVPAGAKIDAAGPLTIADIAAMRATMGRYGLDPTQLVLLVSVSSLYGLITDPTVTTVDKYGQNATLLSGELGRIWGIPIIASDQIRTNLNAVGVYDGITMTKSIAMIVHRRAFMRGIRRNTTVQVLTELYAESDQDAVLVTTRQAFTARWPGEPAVSLAYNVG